MTISAQAIYYLLGQTLKWDRLIDEDNN